MAGSTKGKKYMVYDWKRIEVQKKRYTVYINNCDSEKNAFAQCGTAATAATQACRQFNFHKKRVDLLVLDNKTREIIKKYKRIY